MKLFVSYGHDKHQDFVRRIKGDLLTRGHAPWIDSEKIHQHADWRRSLMLTQACGPAAHPPGPGATA